MIQTIHLDYFRLSPPIPPGQKVVEKGRENRPPSKVPYSCSEEPCNNSSFSHQDLIDTCPSIDACEWSEMTAS
jgi:hypothetical protein